MKATGGSIECVDMKCVLYSSLESRMEERGGFGTRVMRPTAVSCDPFRRENTFCIWGHPAATSCVSCYLSTRLIAMCRSVMNSSVVQHVYWSPCSRRTLYTRIDRTP